MHCMLYNFKASIYTIEMEVEKENKKTGKANEKQNTRFPLCCKTKYENKKKMYKIQEDYMPLKVTLSTNDPVIAWKLHLKNLISARIFKQVS